jgi:hypothetical protein
VVVVVMMKMAMRIADDKIHTGPHKTAIMVGSIKCHIDY